MATELGTGWIRIAPDVSQITPEVSKALDATQASADSSGKGMGSKIVGGLRGVMKTGMISVGTAAGATLGASITKGVGRLTAIENAEAKLSGLGNSAEDVSNIMDNALVSVKGTAYGLDAAATTAAMAVASGIEPGERLEQVLTTVADTAGIAGASMDEMGAIFGSVAARGKLQGDDLMQLTSRGIPVLQMLGDELGKTSEEISDMVSKGEIDFETFESALRNHIGGAAQEAGKTTSGSFANMWAAASRFGAKLAGPFYNQAAGVFTGITNSIDNLADKSGPYIDRFDSWIGGSAIPKLRELGTTAKDAAAGFLNSSEVQSLAANTKDVFSELITSGARLAPTIGQIAGELAKASASLGISGWQLFLTTLEATNGVITAFTPAIEALSGFMADHPALVTAAVAAYTGFKTVPGIIEKATGALEPHATRLGKVKTELTNLGPGIRDLKRYYSETGREIGNFDAAMQMAATSNTKYVSQMARSYTQASAPLKEFAASHKLAAAEAKTGALQAGNSWVAADRMIAQAGHSVVGSVTNMAGTIKGGGAGAFTGIKSAASSAVNFLGGPWVVGIAAATFAISDARAAAAALDHANAQMAASARESAQAQKELEAALAGTTGALNEQEIATAAKIVKSEISDIVELGSRKFSMVENLNMATVAVDEFMDKIPLMSSEEQKARTVATRQAKTMRDAYDSLKDGADELGISIDDVNSVVAEGGSDYRKLVSNLRESGDAGNRAADQLEEARAKVEKIVDSARNIDPAFAQASAAIDVLADSAASGEDKLSALEKLMESMGLAPKMAEEALMDTADAVDKMVESAANSQLPVETLGDALFGLDGKLEPTNSSARMLHENLTDLRQQLEQAAVSGADTQEAFDLMQPALQSLKEQFGLTDDQLQGLIQSYGLVPENITTAVNLEGASETTQSLASVWASLDGLEEGKTINVGVLDEKAAEYIDRLGYDIEKLPDGTFEVTSNTEEASNNLHNVVNRMAEIDGTDVDVSLALDNSQFEMNAQQAQDLINYLDIQNPSPQAQMIIDQLKANHSIAMGDLAVLDAQSPKPTADLAKHLLDNKVKDANGSLTKLAGRQPKPKLDADTGSFNSKVNGAISLINSLPQVKVVKFVAERIGNWVSGNAGGGRVPKLASGGRLPVYGPGTNVIDGFLGVDEAGMPTVRVNRGEWVVNGHRSNLFNGTIGALNSGSAQDIVDNLYRELPHLSGGTTLQQQRGQSAPGELQALAGGGVIGSITDIVKKKFPMMTITSTLRNSNDYHGMGKAVDFSNGYDDTPEMQSAAKYFADNYGSQLLELIHAPFNHNIKNGKSVGDGMSFYGAGTMGQHRNHVHVAADAPLAQKDAKVAAVDNAKSASTDSGSGATVTKTSRSMQWSNDDKKQVSFGSADSIYKGVAKALKVGERKEFRVGKTSESRTSVTPSDTKPLKGTTASGSGHKGWGHEHFVEEIARNAKAHGLPDRGAMIGVGTAFVESGNPLKMYANQSVPDSLQYRHDAVGSDHDSVGLFQQRQAGWGTLAQRMNPYQSAGLFFDAMLRKFPNWGSMEPGAVAQGVQVSAFPDRYAKVMGAALQAVKNTSLYDSGGWLEHGKFAHNLSGKPEPVLTAGQWGDVHGTMVAIPRLVGSIDRLVPVLADIARTGKYTGNHGLDLPENSTFVVAAKKVYAVSQNLEAQAKKLEKGYINAGRQLTAWTNANVRWFDNTEIVVDAEAGLQETREQNAQDLANLKQAEKQLAEARSNLAKAESEDAALSTKTKRKLADAERKVEEARKESIATSKDSEATQKQQAAKAKKLADAERNLRRAREDAAAEMKKSGNENAESVASAIEDVQTAEEQLSNARENVSQITARTEAAERTLAGARIKVVSDLVGSLSDAVDSAFDSLGKYVDQAIRFGGIVEETKQSISKLAQERVTLNLATIKSLGDLRIAEWDVARARMDGAIDVASAEADLAKAREGHLVMGATSVSALGDAVDRFRVLGMDAADALGTSVVTNAKEIRAAEAALAKARATAAIGELEAQNRARVASIAAAKATVLQAQNAAVLTAHTEMLAKQSAQLNGMNNRQQTALQQRVQGGQKTAGGILGLLGGLVMGGLGVTTMNPALIASAIGMGAKGIADTVTGATILKHHDKKAADEAWKALPRGDRVGIGLGAGSSALASAAGIGAAAYTGNAEWATAGLDAGNQIWDATITGMAERQKAAFDKIDAEYADAMADIEGKYGSKIAGLDAQQAAVEADYQMKREALAAEEAYQELQKRIAESSTKVETEALVKASEVAAARREDLVSAARETNQLLKQNVTVQIPAGQAWTSDQLESYLTNLFAEFNGVKADVEQIREDNKPNGLDIIMAGR